MVNTASGATWVSIHHGGGVGMGRSIHAGQVCVADGTELAAQKIERVLTNDPGMGVIRHVDAGYDRADEVAAERGRSHPHAGRSMTFESLWRDLAPIGRSASSGGYFRQPWASAELELRAWFREAAAARGLEVEEDPFGNLVAWWCRRPPRFRGASRSHLNQRMLSLPAATSTASSTAARTTARSVSSPRWPRST